MLKSSDDQSKPTNFVSVEFELYDRFAVSKTATLDFPYQIR